MDFNEIYDTHYSLACSIARKYVNHNDVQDVVHEAMIRVFRYMDTIRDERKSFFFLYYIFKNTAINWGKAQSIRPLGKSEELPEEIYMDQHFENWFEEADKSLSELDDMTRQVTLLKLQGYSQKEVSAKLDIGRKVFYDLWARGKKHLIENL